MNPAANDTAVFDVKADALMPLPPDNPAKLTVVVVPYDIKVGAYFPFLDSVVAANDTVVNYKLTEHLLVHANPWIIDTLGKAYSNGCVGTAEGEAWIIYYHAPVGTKVSFRYDLTVTDEKGDKLQLKDIYRLKEAQLQPLSLQLNTGIGKKDSFSFTSYFGTGPRLHGCY